MSARGMFFGEGPTACPFVALESDRDRRSDEPDHRHRCYAEPDPAPRALAHQREYCLAAAFTACPIFQDWAIRAAATPVPLRPGRMQDVERDEQPVWAAPPRWLEEEASPQQAASDERAAAQGEGEESPDQGAAEPQAAGLIPPPLSPAGEQVERIPSREADWGEGTAEPEPRPEDVPVPAFLAGRAARAQPEVGRGQAQAERAAPEQRSDQHAEARRVHVPRNRAEREAQRDEIVAPWQREPIYATRSRVNLPGSGNMLSRLTTLLAIGFILALAVLAILVAPSLLDGRGGPAATLPVAGGSPTPALQASPTPSPEPTPSPSPRTYTVRAGDTLFAIARRHGLTVEQLLAANPQVTNPNVVTIGQVLFIPDDDFVVPSPSP